MNNLFKNNVETTLLDKLALPKQLRMRLIAKKSSKKKERGSMSIIWVIFHQFCLSFHIELFKNIYFNLIKIENYTKSSATFTKKNKN